MGFLVIAENYLGEGDKFNATETLQSIIENAPDEHIKKLAQNRLKEVEKMKEGELSPKKSIQAPHNTSKDPTKHDSTQQESKPDKKPNTKKEKDTPPTKADRNTDTPQDNKTPNAEQADLPKGKSFHLIVETYATADAAEKSMVRWRARGFKPVLLTDAAKQKYRISLVQAGTKAEVKKQQEALFQKGEIEPDTWIKEETR
jgi:cell division septation protein DedD